MLQNLKLTILQLTTQNKILAISISVFVLLYLILNAKNNAAPPVIEKKSLYADTLIPRGQVLVPLELANITALASLIDQFGIIDLYAGAENNSALIASRVKILRAPLNPNQYAVMVSEELSQEIMRHKGPYWAVVQNRYAQSDPMLEKPESKTLSYKTKKPLLQPSKKIEIEYYVGGE